jgi:DNA invertase Pin-like site-specific DNA recombinase
VRPGQELAHDEFGGNVLKMSARKGLTCGGRAQALATVQHLENCGVDLFIDQQSIDTTTPTGKLMFQIVGAFAEFERSMIRQRVHAGLKRALANGKTLGRPLNDPAATCKSWSKATNAYSTSMRPIW